MLTVYCLLLQHNCFAAYWIESMSDETKSAPRERRAGNWIQGFRFFTSESESPDSYLFWTAMSTLAGAVQRQLHVKWIYYDFYPNLYIVLVGPPGKVHKSSAIAFARSFLREIEVPVSSEAITKEGLVAQMIEKHNKATGASAITVVSSELMTFMAPSGEKMIEFLTDIFDTPNEWESATRSRGSETIKKPYVNLLAGTTPSYIASGFDVNFVEQGLASRTLFIFENRPRFHKAFANITPEMWEMRDRLAEDLRHIASLQGEFKWTEDGQTWFANWYEKELPNESLDYRLEGYLARKPTHLIKVAMLLAIAESDTLLLDERILSMAKSVLDGLEPAMARTFSSVGRNPYASDLERIWNDIIVAGGMTRGELVQKNYHAMGKQALDETIENLCLMGYVRKELKGSQIFYNPVPGAGT